MIIKRTDASMVNMSVMLEIYCTRALKILTYMEDIYMHNKSDMLDPACMSHVPVL